MIGVLKTGNKMRILITGGNGYIGARLSKFLAERDFKVSVLCYPSIPKDSEWIQLMEHVIVGDITDELILDELSKYNFDMAIHLISLDHNQCNNFSFNDVLKINVNSTGNLLEKLSKRGLRKFIYFSTFQVYGRVENSTITEEHPASPINLYGLTHLLSENIVSYYNSTTDIDCISVRLSNSYGSPVFQDNNCWWLVINELCRDAYFNGKIQLKSDGSPLRDFIHSSDLCSAIQILLNHNTKSINNVYNISSGITLSILELALIVRKIYFNCFKKSINIYLPDGNEINYNLLFNQNARFKIVNNKIKKIGFSAVCNIDDGIKDLFNYLYTTENS